MIRSYGQFFSIIKKMGRDKEDIVDELTNGRTDSLTALSDAEFTELMRRIQQFNTPPPGNDQRRKMIAIAKKMHWGRNTREILAALDGWLLKQKYAKPMMQLSLQELGVMVTIFENQVYTGYLKGLNK